MKNRRRDVRYPVHRTGIITFEGRAHAIETLNLSLSGVRISLDMPLLEGSEVSIKLHLPESPFFGVLAVVGVVAWCSEGMDVGYEAGIRLFPELHDRMLLETYLVGEEVSFAVQP